MTKLYTHVDFKILKMRLTIIYQKTMNAKYTLISIDKQLFKIVQIVKNRFQKNKMTFEKTMYEIFSKKIRTFEFLSFNKF